MNRATIHEELKGGGIGCGDRKSTVRSAATTGFQVDAQWDPWVGAVYIHTIIGLLTSTSYQAQVSIISVCM